MNSIKKTIACMLICFHATTHTNDETLYGFLLAGLTITGIAIAGKIVRNSAVEAQKELEKNCLKAQALLLKTDATTIIRENYGTYKHHEKALEYLYRELNSHNYYKIGLIITRLKEEIEELQAMQKNIASPFSQNNEIIRLQKDISLRLHMHLDLLSIVEKHLSYFKLRDMRNTYEGMPTYQGKFIEWIIMKSGNSLYPLLDYKEKAADDIKFIDSCNISNCPDLATKMQTTKKEIERSLALLYGSDKIAIEVENKKQNEIQAAQVKIAQDKNNIALRTVKAQEQIARDQAEIARTTKNIKELEHKKVEEIQKQNALMILRYPIDQENNRLQAEKNRLESEKNRLLSERNRIDLLVAENRRREIAALEIQNRLQAERDQREQDRINPSHLYTQAHVVPSAPPAEDESHNMPVARPYSGENLPEATAIYPKK